MRRSADTLAWATRTPYGRQRSCHCIVCIERGCVLGLYSDTLHFEVEMHALMNVHLYMWL